MDLDDRVPREALRGFERGQPLVFPGLAYGAMMRLLDCRGSIRTLLLVRARRLGKLLVGGAEYPAEGGCSLRIQVAISAEMRLNDIRG
jgi:hypothetical protein